MKKIILLFAAMSCMMVAKADFIVDGINYDITSEYNKTVEVISYDYSGSVVVPAKVTYEGVTYSVTGIAGNAFYPCDDLTSVTLPEGLKTIGYGAFYSCGNLVSVNIPSTVTKIDSYAFSECENLESLTLPEGLKTIENESFEYCKKLTSITIPSTVTSIGEGPFASCSSLSSISVAEGNTVYDSRDNCNAIIKTATNTLMAGCKNTVIPSSVTALGIYAFSGCTGLTSITLPKGLEVVGYSAFSKCENLAIITIPNSVTELGEYAFNNCKSLTYITIPSKVTKIGYGAFYNCTEMKSMTVLPSNPPTLGDYGFNYVDKSIPVYVPDVDAYSGWGGFTNFIAIEVESFMQSTIDEINAAKEDVSLTDEEKDDINDYIAVIENVESLSDESLAIIEKAKQEAFAIISQAKAKSVREAALAAIEDAMQGEKSDYLDGLVQQYINTINVATNVAIITNAQKAAVEALNEIMEAYKTGKNDTIGSLGTKQNGPVLILTDQDDNEVILYSPKSVEYIKVNEK